MPHQAKQISHCQIRVGGLKNRIELQLATCDKAEELSYNTVMEFDKLVVSFLADEVVGGFFISVPPGHVACVYDRGRGILPRVWGPGLHLKIPFWQVVKLFNAQIIEFSIRDGFDYSSNKEALGDTPVHATTSDGQDVKVEGSILFRIDRHNAPELWENIGENVVSKVVRPVSRSKIANIISEVSLDQVKQHRQKIEEMIQEALNEYFRYRGIDCEGFLLARVVKVTEQGEQQIVNVQETDLSPETEQEINTTVKTTRPSA